MGQKRLSRRKGVNERRTELDWGILWNRILPDDGGSSYCALQTVFPYGTMDVKRTFTVVMC